jgi:hypothetical protein
MFRFLFVFFAVLAFTGVTMAQQPAQQATPQQIVTNLVTSRAQIEAQTVPVEIIKCCTDGGVQASREACQVMAAKITSMPKYVIMADPDRVCCNSNDRYKPILDNVEMAVKFLDEHDDFGGVSLVHPRDEKDPDPAHVDIGWCMYRYEVFAELKFPEGEELCISVTKQIRARGYKFRYIDSLNRIMHCEH